MQNMNTEVAELVEGLMLCFGFESAEQVFDVSTSRFGGSDVSHLHMLLSQLQADAYRTAKPKLDAYRETRDGKIDSAIRRFAVTG